MPAMRDRRALARAARVERQRDDELLLKRFISASCEARQRERQARERGAR